MMKFLHVAFPNPKAYISSLTLLCAIALLSTTNLEAAQKNELNNQVFTPPPSGVELDYFRSKVRDSNTVILSWVTLSENMNLAFKIMMSRNGYDYTEVGTVAGFGTTTEPQAYQFTYDNALPGRTYFKLVQVSESYRSTELDQLYVVIGRDDVSVIIAPNPVVSIMSINTDYPLTTDVQIINAAGQLVKVVPAEQALNIDLGELPRGLYIVVTEYGSKKIQLAD